MRSVVVLQTLAANTVLELLRQKVLTILIILGLLMVGGANFFSQFNFDQEQDFKFIKDFAVGILTLVGVLVAIISVAQMLPAELESRTVLTILSKPVHRWEFLLGKFAGICVLLLGLTLAIAVMLGGVLAYQERTRLADLEQEYAAAVQAGQDPGEEAKNLAVENILKQSRDVRLGPVLVMAYLKIVLTAAIGLLLSTIATSMLFTAIITSLIYVAGHLMATAREVWMRAEGGIGWVMRPLIAVVAVVIPDMGAFNLIDEIVAGNAISLSHTLEVMGYALVYIGVVLTTACLIFSSREL